MHRDSTDSPTPSALRGRLLSEVRRGSQDALAHLLELYRPLLRVWARRSPNDALRNKFDTSDVVQDTVCAALKRPERFYNIAEEDLEHVLKDLLAAQISAIRKHYWRVKKRHVAREQAINDDDSWRQLSQLVSYTDIDVAEVVTLEQHRQQICELLEQLPCDDQVIIKQRMWQLLTWDQISTHHGCSEDAARMRFNRAVGRLASNYRRKYPRE